MRHKRSSFRRKGPRREEKPVVLIVCEGEKTETYYFEQARLIYNLTSVNIKILGKQCDPQPLKIVDYAQTMKSKYEKEDKEIDEVWCVFDRDQHHGFDEALQLAEKNGFKVALSNPCFELWYLIHYRDQESEIKNKKVIRELKREIPNYEKSDRDIFQKTGDKLPDAIKRAKRLRKLNKEKQKPATSNPSTSVDKLIEYFQKIDRDSHK
ncbi:MAG TPA: RloB family protein [bacterium]|nr:RloB family protein [bacterium]